MTNLQNLLNDLTLVEADKNNDFYSHISHVPFKQSELENAKIVQVHYNNDSYMVLDVNDYGMHVHRLTKKGELDKRKGEEFICSYHINAMYVEELEVEELEVEELEVEIKYDLNDINSVKEIIENFKSGMYGTKNSYNEDVIAIRLEGEGLEVRTFQDNGWLRVNYFNEQGYEEGESFMGRWTDNIRNDFMELAKGEFTHENI